MKKIVLGILTVILIAAMIIFIPKIVDFHQRQIVKGEVKAIFDLDFSSGKIDTEVKSKKSYAVVEKVIKNYMEDYMTIYRANFEILNSDDFVAILSSENIKEDGPLFNNTKKYIDNAKKELNKNYDILINMSKKESLQKAIDAKKLDKKYVEFYQELMIDGVFVEEDAEISEMKDKTNRIITQVGTVLEFLTKNKDKWAIKDNILTFYDKDLLTQYNTLVVSIGT